jgi:hypothetical protein
MVGTSIKWWSGPYMRFRVQGMVLFAQSMGRVPWSKKTVQGSKTRENAQSKLKTRRKLSLLW